jgi:hypothetical protein
MQSMNTRIVLTKSKFLEHLQCSERLHKSLTQPREFDEATKNILQNGNEVGLLARKLFSNGVEVGEINTYGEDYLNSELQMPGNIFFEASFKTNTGLLARIDILTVLADKSLKISEVKSTTSFKESEHLPDIYFQKRVIEEVTGLKVSELELIHINSEYEFDGTWNIKEYFKVEKIPFQNEIQKQVFEKIDKCLLHLQEGFPKYSIGPHCKKPNICPHYNVCNSNLDSILTLRRGGGKSWLLHNNGIKRISEVKDVSLLTPFQLKQFESEKFGRPVIDYNQLREFLNGISYPCSFLDFEGFSTPIIHELGLLNIKPYSQIIFQAELKTAASMDTDYLEEYGIIAIPGIDPRRQVADFLNKYIPDSGSVVVYFKTYEVTRIRELIHLFPEYKNKFTSIIDRIVDLEEVFSKGLYVSFMSEGSTSLKVILGLLCDDMTNAYEDLGLINNGQLANIKYLQYFKGLVKHEEKELILSSLKKYCSLDVYSLWKITKQLRRICETRK